MAETGYKVFKDKTEFEEFLAIIPGYGGAADTGLVDVSLEVINTRVGLLLNSKQYGENFLFYF